MLTTPSSSGSKFGCVEQSVGQYGTLARRSTRLECVPGWHSKPLPAGRMSFSLWTVDCRGIPGQRNRVVTRRGHSSQAVLGPENRGFPALRANRLPANCSDQAFGSCFKRRLGIQDWPAYGIGLKPTNRVVTGWQLKRGVHPSTSFRSRSITGQASHASASFACSDFPPAGGPPSPGVSVFLECITACAHLAARPARLVTK